jgi:hypothetical protein
MPVATVRMFGSKMMSSGGKPTVVDEEAVGALADADLLGVGGGLALLVEGHDDHGGAVAKMVRDCSMKLRLALLEGDGVDDALALEALQARLDDSHLEESTMKGTWRSRARSR